MKQYLNIFELNNRIFLYGIIFIILISGSLHINQNIANKGHGYFVLKNIDQANAAAKLGYIKYEVNDYAETFGLPWKSDPGVRRIIRSGPEDFDDIGYISILELITLSGKKMTLSFLENLHNIIFLISVVMLAFIVRRFCGNIFAGWLFLILALILKANILSFLYGSPDSRTFAVSFPCVTIALIFLLNRLSKKLLSAKGLFLISFFGVIVGVMTLIRYSEGIAVLYTAAIFVLLLGISFRQKVVVLATIFLSYFLIIFIIPIAFALHRDIKTGEFNGNLRPYMKTTGNHPAWHSLIVGIGKYPNKLGMKYYDLTCYDIVRARYPSAMHPKYNIHAKGYYDALRKIYFRYVIDHPFEYVFNMSKSFAEIFYFIPYATSAGNLAWSYGYLPIKPGVMAFERDKSPSVCGLVALRMEYLKINFIYWAAFGFAIFNIFLAGYLTFYTKKTNFNKNVFISIIIYLGLLTIQRAIVPQHGLTLVVGFWMFSAICFSYLIFTDNAVRYIFSRHIKNLISRLQMKFFLSGKHLF